MADRKLGPADVATALIANECFLLDGTGPGSFGAVIRFAGEEQCLSGHAERTTPLREEVRAILAILRAVPRDRPVAIASAIPTGAISTVKAFIPAVTHPPRVWPTHGGVAPLERIKAEPELWSALYQAARGRYVYLSNKRGLLRWRLDLPRQHPLTFAKAATLAARATRAP